MKQAGVATHVHRDALKLLVRQLQQRAVWQKSAIFESAPFPTHNKQAHNRMQRILTLGRGVRCVQQTQDAQKEKQVSNEGHLESNPFETHWALQNGNLVLAGVCGLKRGCRMEIRVQTCHLSGI
jgi:hypothetical protein